MPSRYLGRRVLEPRFEHLQRQLHRRQRVLEFVRELARDVAPRRLALGLL
jgi:hypothetical protein